MKFQAYLKREKIKRKDAAKQLEVSVVCIGYWCREERVPKGPMIAKIWEWSKRRVRPGDFYR